jgi:predicted AAA+ superfamily ATPase
MKGAEKVFVTDHGLVNAFAVASASDQRVRSRAFEAVVFRHLRDLAREQDGDISYSRQKDDLEIDFVLELPGRRVAIEVTSSGSVRERKVERLVRAADELGAEEKLLVFGGLTESVQKGVRVIPIGELLMRPERVLERGTG